MNREEIYKELRMSYEELQQYLTQKYGGAVCDYFATPECKSKSKKYLVPRKVYIAIIWTKIRVVIWEMERKQNYSHLSGNGKTDWYTVIFWNILFFI